MDKTEVYAKLKLVCRYNKIGIEDGQSKDTCRLECNIPKGQSWGSCTINDCSLVKYNHDDNSKTPASGYAIKTTGYQKTGELYKDGYYGDGWYSSPIDAEIYKNKDEAEEVLKSLREEFNDGTVVFDLCKITREIKIQVEKIKI